MAVTKIRKNILQILKFLSIVFAVQLMAFTAQSSDSDANCGYIVGLMLQADESQDDLKFIKSRILSVNSFHKGMKAGTSNKAVKNSLDTTIKKLNNEISRITNKIKKHKRIIDDLMDSYDDQCSEKSTKSLVSPSVDFQTQTLQPLRPDQINGRFCDELPLMCSRLIGR